MAVYDAGAVGVGTARKKYEGLLQKFFKKAFEVTITSISCAIDNKYALSKYPFVPYCSGNFICNKYLCKCDNFG